eukprot:80232_1
MTDWGLSTVFALEATCGRTRLRKFNADAGDAASVAIGATMNTILATNFNKSNTFGIFELGVGLHLLLFQILSVNCVVLCSCSDVDCSRREKSIFCCLNGYNYI